MGVGVVEYRGEGITVKPPQLNCALKLAHARNLH